MTEKLEHARFLENLNSKFRLQVQGSDEVELELTEVSELKETPRQEMFSIVFRSSSSVVMPQQTYRLEHDKLSEFDLFLVPIRRDDQGVYYEAVFNRIRPLEAEA